MIQIDLAAARKAWIEEVKPEERLERERSSRLVYKDERGNYFDFHALRGQFVSNLTGWRPPGGGPATRPALDDQLDDGELHAA